jgi:hypothetical protein
MGMKESAIDKNFEVFTRLIEGDNKRKVFLGSDIRTAISFAKKIPEVIELIELGKLSSYLLVSEFMDGVSAYAIHSITNLKEPKEELSRAEEIAYTIIGGELWFKENRNNVELMRDDVMRSMRR